MISLTPIDERIQKRLFQKMELLGNKREIPNVSLRNVSHLNKCIIKQHSSECLQF